MEHAIDKDDSVITAYRCHGWTYMRGRSTLQVLAELTGMFQLVVDSTVYGLKMD